MGEGHQRDAADHENGAMAIRGLMKRFDPEDDGLRGRTWVESGRRRPDVEYADVIVRLSTSPER